MNYSKCLLRERDIYTVLEMQIDICDFEALSYQLTDCLILSLSDKQQTQGFFDVSSMLISKCVGGSSTLPVILFDCTDLLSDCLKHLLDTGAFFG